MKKGIKFSHEDFHKFFYKNKKELLNKFLIYFTEEGIFCIDYVFKVNNDSYNVFATPVSIEAVKENMKIINEIIIQNFKYNEDNNCHIVII